MPKDMDPRITTGLVAVIAGKDGEKKEIPVSREDLITTEEGEIVGVINKEARPGDELIKVYKEIRVHYDD